MSRSDERREFIAMRLGETLLDMPEMRLSDVKACIAKARAWMAQEDLRDGVAKVLEGGGDTRERLKELLK